MMPEPSLLDAVTIVSPCSEDWAAMTGDDRVRRCQACRLDVVNVSAMTRDEAEAFLGARRQGRTCVRFQRRADGTIVTGDCLTVAARLRRRVSWAAAALAGLLGLGSAALAGSASESGGLGSYATWQRVPFRNIAPALPPSWVPSQPPVVMGEMWIPTPPPGDSAADGTDADIHTDDGHEPERAE